MKKYLLPSGLILLLGLSLAVAQSITKSIQLSQDSTGSIGVDTSNNVYFPAHILSTGKLPTASSPLGTAPTIATGSTDFQGTYVGGSTGNTTAAIIFANAFAAAPNCIVAQVGGTASSPNYTPVASGINISNATTGAAKYSYICSGAQ